MKVAVNGNAEIVLTVPHGSKTEARATEAADAASPARFVKTNYQEDLLAELVQTYAVADFCLIGKLEELGFPYCSLNYYHVLFRFKGKRKICDDQ